MRHSMATALLILATLGVAAAERQTASPPAQEQQSPAQKQDALPGSPGHQRQVDDALKSESGRAGKAEPLSQAIEAARLKGWTRAGPHLTPRDRAFTRLAPGQVLN
jgi:hypothetical protein